MQNLTVTLIQSELFWEDISANLAAFDKKIDAISEKNGYHYPSGDVYYGLHHERRKTGRVHERLRGFLDHYKIKAQDCPYPGKRYYRGR